MTVRCELPSISPCCAVSRAFREYASVSLECARALSSVTGNASSDGRMTRRSSLFEPRKSTG